MKTHSFDSISLKKLTHSYIDDSLKNIALSLENNSSSKYWRHFFMVFKYLALALKLLLSFCYCSFECGLYTLLCQIFFFASSFLIFYHIFFFVKFLKNCSRPSVGLFNLEIHVLRFWEIFFFTYEFTGLETLWRQELTYLAHDLFMVPSGIWYLEPNNYLNEWVNEQMNECKRRTCMLWEEEDIELSFRHVKLEV